MSWRTQTGCGKTHLAYTSVLREYSISDGLARGATCSKPWHDRGVIVFVRIILRCPVDPHRRASASPIVNSVQHISSCSDSYASIVLI
jgi:hypothetical protein